MLRTVTRNSKKIDEEMEKIYALHQGKRYYTSTPEMLKAYAEMVPPVDEQK